MPYDGGDVYVKVELFLNGAWVEVTTRARGGRAASGVEIDRGRGTGALQAESATCSLTLGNDDGFVTEGNPFSPWYPYIGRGCRIRVSIADVAVSDVLRFDGEIDTIVAVYPGGSDSSMRITATGILGGTLGLGSDPLRSPLYRSISSTSPGAYWALEDSSGSTGGASGITGGAALVGDATFGGASLVPAGSAAAIDMSAGGNLTAPTGIARGSVTSWEMEGVFGWGTIPSTSSQANLIVGFSTPGSSVTEWGIGTIESSGTLRFGIYRLSSGGVSLGFSSQPIEAGILYHFRIRMEQNGADVDYTRWLDGVQVGSGSEVGVTLCAPTQIKFNTGASTTQMPTSMSHVAAWTPVRTTANTYLAVDGHAGETVDERLDRLCSEEGIALTITGTSTQTMGSQGIDTLANLLIDGEAVDGGLLSDGGDGGGLAYRCLSDIVNQSASLAVTQGSLDVDVAPIWDNRNIRNDVTISRPGGSSARRSDEAHIARTRRRIKDSDTVNVETDDQLDDQAGWRVNVGTADGPRYNGVGINLRNSDGRLLADAVLALEMGDRFTAAEATLPPQHPPGGIDGLVVGWREELDKDKWLFAPNVVPYAPNEVAVYGTDPGGVVSRYGARDTTLAEDLTDSDTSWLVDTGIDTWATTASHPDAFPFDIDTGGLTYSCTAIGPSASDNFGTAGTNGWPDADTGQAWTPAGGVAADYSKTGGVGRIVVSATGSDRWVTLDAASTDQDVTVVLETNTTPVGGTTQYGLGCRFTDSSNYYLGIALVDTSGNISARILKRVAGSLTTLGTTTVPGAVIGSNVLVRFRVVGSTLQLRLWQQGGTEPTVWHVDVTDTSLTTGSRVGCFARRDSGNSSPTNFDFDTFRLNAPLTFTVTRLATDKAHSTGDQVTVTDTGRYAL